MVDKEKIQNYPIAIITILMGLIFILSIAIIGTFGTIKSKSKKISTLNKSNQLFSKNYSAISATFSFEVILFVAFIILFVIIYCIKFDKVELVKKIMLFILIICQFLYLINCILMPVYLKEYKYIIELCEKILLDSSQLAHAYLNQEKLKKIKDISGYYKGIIWTCYIFLIIILLLDCLLLNLYHFIFCNTGSCLFSFVNWFLDMFCNSFYKQQGSTTLETQNEGKRNKINNLTDEIKELLSEKLNIEINNKKKEIIIKLNNQ